MLLLRDVRDYIATLNVTVDNNVYCGKMADKVNQSIGVYNLRSGRRSVIPVGGMQNKSYDTKGISILVHWNKSPTQAETSAYNLHNLLQQCNDVTINSKKIKFIQMFYDEPISVNTDDNGIFEYVIECLIYSERNE